MNKRNVLIISVLLVLLVGTYINTTPLRIERVVKRLLRSPELKVEVATKLMGGREPVYGAIVAYDEGKGPDFCTSLGLAALTPEDRRANILRAMKTAFPDKFPEATNQNLQIYVGTLKHAPFATDAVIGRQRIHFIFSRY